MNQNFHKIATSCSILLGVGLCVGFSVIFKDKGRLGYEPNPACAKGSPYGKVLALAMQGPIDFYWHEGATHSHGDVLHGDGVHSHDGHEHSHDHSEPEPVVERVGEQRGVADKAFRVQVKEWIKEVDAQAHRRTNDRPLSPAHLKHLRSITEDKLRLAYELDPTNYTNYGNLHLFLSFDLGKSKGDLDKGQALAVKTLEICKRDRVDPSSWVTACSAAYNIVSHVSRNHADYTIAEAKASLKDFDDCMVTFERLLDLAVEEGRIVSVARLNELQERVKYLRKLRRAHGVYMKRMMSESETDDVNQK